MRKHLMLALAGLLLLTSSGRADVTPTVSSYIENYRETWFATAEEKKRCAAILSELSGEDLALARKKGDSINQAMRDTNCLDAYSYIFGTELLAEGAGSTKLDKPSVEMIGSYLFMYINTFENTGEDLIAQLKKLDEHTVALVKTVVIDVRGNPGGFIHTLRDVLDVSFAPKKDLRFLKLSGKATYGTYYTTSRTGMFVGRNIRVLTDPATASSSEWLIETLCYEWYPDKCSVVGSPTTFGKSQLQCLSPKLGTKLTCGEWFMADRQASGKDQSRVQRLVRGVGITPDRPLDFDCDRFAYQCIAKKLADADL